MSTVKNQHYVPQFYLRGFTDGKGRVCTFDKTTSEAFLSNPSNLASERYFYDQKQIDKVFGEQYIEKYLGEIESKFAPLLSDLLDAIEKMEVFKIDKSVKFRICEYLTMQILRTKEQRQDMIQLFELMKKTMLERVLLTEQQIDDMGFNLGSEDVRFLHNSQLLPDKRFASELCDLLNSHICLIFKNGTSVPFYTSDNPVARKAHSTDPIRSTLGWGSKGLEIVFPLSSKYLMMLLERSTFKHYEQYEGEVLMMQDAQNIAHYNSLQVISSYRYVFSSLPNFDLAKQMIEANGYLGDLNRRRHTAT